MLQKPAGIVKLDDTVDLSSKVKVGIDLDVKGLFDLFNHDAGFVVVVVVEVMREGEETVFQRSIVGVKGVEFVCFLFPGFCRRNRCSTHSRRAVFPAVLFDMPVVTFKCCVPGSTIAEGGGADWTSEIAEELPVELSWAAYKTTSFSIVEL